MVQVRGLHLNVVDFVGEVLHLRLEHVIGLVKFLERMHRVAESFDDGAQCAKEVVDLALTLLEVGDLLLEDEEVPSPDWFGKRSRLLWYHQSLTGIGLLLRLHWALLP